MCPACQSSEYFLDGATQQGHRQCCCTAVYGPQASYAFLQVSAAVRKMQEEVEARQRAEAEAARLAEEQRIWVCFGPAFGQPL